jgi:heme oxygenase
MSDASLSARLRADTRELHVQAERSGVMAGLLRGQLPLERYGALVAALYEIYDALEEGLDANAEHPAVAPLRRPGLARRAALAADLAVLRRLGLAPAAATPGATSYAEHLRRVAADDPVRLVAHAWLRYLGDLNGGRILERVVRERLGVPEGAMAFYRFPALADPAAAAVQWRAALDELPIDAATVDALVAEASDGFHRHIALFEELADAQDAAEASSEA